MSETKVTVLLVDDCLVAITLLKRALSPATDIEVVGVARNGREALALIPSLNPSVVCTDLHMPGMNGLELTREIMSHFPRPILVVSSSVAGDSSQAFNLLEAGALDVLAKPRILSDAEFSTMAADFINKIRILAGVHVFRRPPASDFGKSHQSSVPLTEPKPVKIIIIGASTGGPQVLNLILQKLPRSLPVPVICMQHISPGFLRGLVEWLAPTCRLPITIAQNGGTPVPGTVYFPEEEMQLQFDSLGRFDIGSSVHGCKPVPVGNTAFSGEIRHLPSIDVTMTSAAHRFGASVLGVLLSGMGSDGAAGMKAIFDRGGPTIAQDEQSCTVYGMPKQAIKLGAAGKILVPEQIAEVLSRVNSEQERGSDLKDQREQRT